VKGQLELFTVGPYDREEPDLTCPCRDCANPTLPEGAPSEFYMVDNAVWASAGDPSGYLCIGCLEVRISRRLAREDFPNLPLNNPRLYGTSGRLVARLTVPRGARSR
jgi:hypothetical protein